MAALRAALDGGGATDGRATSPKIGPNFCGYAERLKALGADDAFALSVVGFNLFWIRLDFDAGLEMMDHAIGFNPNYARALHFRGLVRGWSGESDTAIADLERAMRLSPRDPFNYGAMLGLALAHHNARRHTIEQRAKS